MKFRPTEEIMVKKIKTFQDFLRQGTSTANCTFQGINFSGIEVDWEQQDLNNTSFLGCQLTKQQQLELLSLGAQVYEQPAGLPYQPFRNELYTWQELVKGFSEIQDNSYDLAIYQHFSKYRFNPPIQEALWQRIHDHSMDEALRDLLQFDAEGMTQRKCVGFMGGHSTLRHDPYFKKAAWTAKLLSEAGYFLVSGGGPGIMEAANLGAYFAHRSNADLFDAIKTLSLAPSYKDKNYFTQAFKVLEKYPDGAESLAIPTWFYGHEPSNLFASHIAKYFSNSIREDTLLAICLYGVVYAPGSAGTTQEIFMDATQNHYGTFNYYSPMVFLSIERYEVQTIIFPLLRQLAWGKPYYDLLYLTDEPKAVVRFIKQHAPIKK